MINPNDYKMSPLCTPNPKREDPIMHNGWEIFRWTGWKGRVDECDESQPSSIPISCSVCGKEIAVGDKYIVSQGSDNVDHYDCSTMENKDQIAGQWIATKVIEGEYRFAYSSVTGGPGAYRPGKSFSVIPTDEQVMLTYDTPQGVLEAAREDGLVRLKRYIDDVESGAIPWPEHVWGPKPK